MGCCFGFGEGEGVVKDLLEFFVGKRQQLGELREGHVDQSEVRKIGAQGVEGREMEEMKR